MYCDYFGLKQPPFKITPDTSMFFPGGNRGAILDALIYTILNGEGIIKVVGEVGSGKTMLCRMLEKELPGNVEVVYIANPSLSPENILHAIAFDLNLGVEASTSRLEVMNRLQEYLLKKHSSGQQVVVFIEEAQGMPIATLEEIRLLSNLETQQSKLLQIVLFGQPELDEIISGREIRQLKERITYSFQLNPFNNSDIRDYLNSRLRACGYRSGEIFNGPAVKLIEHYSAGLVRRVNILADKAMLAAYAANTSCIEARHVRQAARDSEFVGDRWRKYWLTAAVVSLLVLTGSVLIWQLASGYANRARLSDTAVPGPVSDRPVAMAAPAADDTQAALIAAPETPARSQDQIETDTQSGSGPGTEFPSGEIIILNTDSYITNSGVEPGSSGTRDPDLGTDGDSLNDTPHGVSAALASSPVTTVENTRAEAAGPESKLMGLEDVYGPREMGNQQYTDEELQILREQLERLPPEMSLTVKPSFDDDICKLCWSIIYRPLVKTDNL